MKIESKLAWDLTELKKLETNNVTLMWMPGHEQDIMGEITYSLAREGGEYIFYASELFCVVPKCYLRIGLELTNKTKNCANTYNRNTYAMVFLKHSYKERKKIFS